MVIIFQSSGIILPFAPKQFPETAEAGCVGNDLVPIIMRDFMPEMAKQRPVGFMKTEAPLFTLGIVRFGDVHGDQPVLMPGHYGRNAGNIREEIELQCRAIFLGLALQGKPKVQQRINEPSLGEFDLVPTLEISGNGQIRNGLVQAARDAKRILVLHRHQPIADLMSVAVLALAILPLIGGATKRAPYIFSGRFQSA